MRDYIHVVDLARGHLAALEHLEGIDGAVAVNLGTGRGSTRQGDGGRVRGGVGSAGAPYASSARDDPGDVAQCYADPSLAERRLGWRAQYDLERMCVDAWRWQSGNPNGYPAD